jgi:hypothetical protein
MMQHGAWGWTRAAMMEADPTTHAAPPDTSSAPPSEPRDLVWIGAITGAGASESWRGELPCTFDACGSRQ